MVSQECGNFIKHIILDLEDTYKEIINDVEFKKLIEEYEKIEDPTQEDEERIQKYSDELFQAKINPIFKKISQENMKEILLHFNNTFMEENHIPKKNLRDILEYIIKNVDDKDYSLRNDLLKNNEFINGLKSVDYSYSTLFVLFENSTDEDTMLRIVQNSIDDCIAGTNNDVTNDYFAQLFTSLVNSPLRTDELKSKLLNDENLIIFLRNIFFEKIVNNPNFADTTKKKLIFDEIEGINLENETKCILISSMCKKLEDYYQYIFDEKLSRTLTDISYIIVEASKKLEFNELRKLLFDERIFSKISSFGLSGIIGEGKMSFEQRKELLFNERFFSKIDWDNWYITQNIFASKNLTTSEKKELLFTEQIMKEINSFYYNVKDLLTDYAVPMSIKVEIIKNENYQKNITGKILNKVLRDDRLSFEDATSLILDDNVFYKVIGEYHEKYNPDESAKKGPFKYDKKAYLMKLYERNPYIAKTISLDLFQDDILDNGFEFIEKMSKYPFMVEKISQIYNNDRVNPNKKNDDNSKLFFFHMRKIIEESIYAKNIDINIYISKIVDSIINANNSYEFSEKKVRDLSMIRHNKNLNFNNFTDENWKTITEIALRNESNYYNEITMNPFCGPEIDEIDKSLNIIPNIETMDDLNNFQERRLQCCDKEFEEAILKRDLDKAKNAYLNKYFNINIQEAIQIERMYGTSIHQFDDKKEYDLQTKYIKQISKILKLEKIETISQIYYDKNIIPLSFDETIYIDQSLRQIFSKDMSDSVYKINDKAMDEKGNLINNPSYMEFNVTINGVKVKKKVPVYQPGMNFKMLIHSTDAYGKLELINNNYFDSWNNNSRKSNHGICCSLISNDNMGMAAVNDVLLGFDSWDAKAISKSAPYDIYSANDSYVLQEGRPLIFMTAQDIINNTRHTHNEQVLERIELRKDRVNMEYPNIQPSYVIIYSDMKDKIKEKAIKCSEDMKIPIVYLDKERIIANEVKKINERIDIINNTNDMHKKIKLIKEVLLIHENNRSGLKMTNPELIDQYFPTEKISNCFENTINHLIMNLTQTKNISEYYQFSKELMDILDEENKKFQVTMETEKRQNYIDIPIEKYKKTLMQVINQNLCKNNIPKLETIIMLDSKEKSDLNLTRTLLSLDLNLLFNSINDIISKNLYPNDEKNHNIGHIERVIVYSQLIGKEELKLDNGELDEHSLELLTECAKYHDCGRKSDKIDKEHGIRSAKKIKELINSNYTDDDIKIMQVAIEYHEIIDDDFKFNQICKKYQLPDALINTTKKIANCLKDADALDRTRFKNSNAQLDKDMLRTESSKKIISFAKALNKRYEEYDEEMFDIYAKQIMMSMQYTNNGIICDGKKR